MITERSWKLDVCLTSMLVVFCTASLAQEPQIQFERLEGAASFSSVGIDAIVQDAQGFMWFGSLGDGLARYDGYEFRVFRHEQSNPYSLSNNEVNHINIAPDGKMWVATSEGLNEFDASTETFTRFLHDPANGESISSSHIDTSLVEADGTLWVGSENGLDRRKPGETGFQHYSLTPAKTDDEAFGGIGPGRVFTMYLDGGNTLWLGTLGGGLLRLDRESESFTRFRHDPNDPTSLTNDNIRDIYEDRAGTFWLATDRGISRMDRSSGTFRNYLPDDNDPQSLRANHIGPLLEDGLGNFWVTSDKLGVSLFDRAAETFSHYFHDPADPRSLIAGRVWSIFEDRSGVVWLGTDGINRLLPTVHAFQLFRNTTESVNEAGTVPNRLLQTGNGTIWMNAIEGIDRFNPATGDWQRFALRPDDPTSGHNEAMAIHEDRGGNLWVAYPRYVSRVDVETGQHTSFEIAHRPLCVYVDTVGRLWLCMPFYGFVEFDIETGEQTRLFAEDPEDPEAISHTFAYFAFEDSSGRFWIGTYSGLNLFDPGAGKFKVYTNVDGDSSSISHSEIRAYFEDSNGNVWFGTENGLNRYNPLTDDFTRFFNGPDTQLNRINGIVAGDANRLWLSLGAGLAEFDPQSEQFRNIRSRDGLPQNFGSAIVHDNHSGLIYMATAAGLVSFDPAKFDINNDSPLVALTDFRIFNKSVPIHTADSPSPLLSGIGSTSQLTLGPEDSLVSFSFSALDYSDPDRNQYAYRLDGYDNDWVETEPNRRIATYTTLPAGDYVFRVKAAGHNGTWNENGATLNLTILPPWWETVWAYVLYAVVVVVLLSLLIQFRTRTLRIKSGELETLVNERTQELSKQKQTIEAQATHLEELIVAKDRYFTNVSHEFRTPLTVILGPIERLLTQISDIDARRYLQTVRRNGSRLLRMVDQLLGLSRIESGQSDPVVPHSVKSTISYIAASLESFAKDKQIILDVDNVEDVWIQSSGDATEEIVINLLSNALKFTPPGGKVSVSAIREDKFIRITVTDTGPGIPADEQENIFERFYRIDDLAEIAPGSGLGLALVKELVAANGGQISLDSTEGVGTIMHVTLPAAEVPNEAAEKSESTAARVSSIIETSVASLAIPEPIGQKASEDTLPNMLVIEDNLDLCRHLEDVFGTTLHCTFAHDGQSGLDTAIDDIPDVIICDAMLPKINGFEVTRHLKQDDRTSHIPIIMLTARVDDESRLRGLRALADDYITKPFNEAELQQRVDTVLAVREILRQRFAREAHHLGTSELKATMSEKDRRFVGRVDDALARYYSDPEFTTVRFASEVAMSERQLQRKLRAFMNFTPREYLRSYRLQEGMKMLRNGSSVADAAYSVGFLSLSYFAKCFKAQFGVTPSDVLDDSDTEQTMSDNVG